MKFLGEVGRARLRAGLGSLLCLTAVALYLWVVDRHYPIKTWLAWPMLTLYAWLVLFCVGCVGAGSLVVDKLLAQRKVERVEAIVLSMAAGVVVFVYAMYVCGALALFGPVQAILLPLGLGACGIRSLPRLWRRSAPAHATRPDWSLAAMAAVAAGALGVALVYLGAMTPDATNYDANWCHLTVGQDYAREGRLVPFPGDYSKAVPHLASIVFSWAFSVPGLEAPLRWMLALHLEFTLFVWTLVGVGAAVTWLAGERVRGAFSAFFLFPYIFVYDHNIGGAADHTLAFFAVPSLLAARHFLARFAFGPAALLGIILGGAALTKYQAIYLIVPLGGMAAVRLLMLAFASFRQKRRPERELWAGPLVLAAVLGATVAPHFIKNVVFYGNPMYPFMQELFASSHPKVPNGAFLVANIWQDKAWVPQGTAWEKISSSLEVFFTFSFVPHYSFTKHVPAFGSLFTLLLPCVLVTRNRRLWFAMALASGGVLIWASTFRVDRNLQTILPVLVAATAGMIVELWHMGRIARVGLVPLVALQIVWGTDAVFFNSYERMTDAVTVIKSGFDGRAASRFDKYRSHFRAVGAAIPKDALVLLHTSHQSLGIDKNIVLDWTGFQGLIHYGGVRTPRELYDYYRKLGITHLLYSPHERAAPSKQEEILWQAMVSKHAKQLGRYAGFRLMQMPEQAPEEEDPYQVLSLGVPGYDDGVYPIGDLDTIEYLAGPLRSYKKPKVPVKGAEQAARMLRRVDAVLLGARHRPGKEASAELRRFTAAIKYSGSFDVYLR
jgi:hypothetical protein